MQVYQQKKSRQELEGLLTEWERRRGLEDLTFLTEEILKYPKVAKVHKEVEQFLQNLVRERKRGVLLLPRNHLKTTFVTICWTIQQILRNPEVRVFITNERLDNAKSFLREIKSHFEKNEKVRALYGNFVNVDEKWTETQIIVNKRTKAVKEPTIQVGSIDTSLVSQHYDIVIGDDLVSRNNIGTKDQIDKVKQYWKDLLSLADQDAIVLDIGTRWHFDDLHGWLLAESRQSDRYRSFVRGCFNENGEPIFPEKFTKEYLESVKKEIGSYDFSCLYMNNPIDDDSADFKRSWFKHRRESELDGLLLNKFITIDTAISKKAEADFTGITINAVDLNNNWYVKAMRFKINPSELISKLFELYHREKPVKIGIERTIYSEALKPFLEAEMRKRNEFLPIEELDHKQVNKELRIRGLIPRYENGAIYHIEGFCEHLEDELTRFPRGQHDDLADALAYQLQIAEQPYAENEVFVPQRVRY